MKELFDEINKWAGKYEFSFQFWGESNNNVWICKDGIELFSCYGCKSMEETVKIALNYIYKVNRIKFRYRIC